MNINCMCHNKKTAIRIKIDLCFNIMDNISIE